jgi:hypothetical protein
MSAILSPRRVDVQAKAPERLPRRQARDRRVLFDDFLRGRAREEVEVEHAAEHPVLDERRVRVWRGQEQDVCARGGREEDAVRGRGRAASVAVLEVERVHAVSSRCQQGAIKMMGSADSFASIGSPTSRAQSVSREPLPVSARRMPELAMTSPSP